MSYTEKPWLPYRDSIVDFLKLGGERNMAHANFEVEISKMTEAISQRKLKVHSGISQLAYLLWCYGQAVARHPEMQGIKKGKKLIIFDDVDVSMIFEKETPNGIKVPIPYIFRAIQKKSFNEILQEFIKAEGMSLEQLHIRKKSKFFQSLPAAVRQWILKRALSNPNKWKEALGTVAFTTLGLIVRNRKFWPIPIGPYGLMMAAGSSYSVQDLNGKRTYLCMVVHFDHNLVDGAPAVRFGKTFMNLIESAEGLTA